MDTLTLKKAAAKAALAYIKEHFNQHDLIIGVGTGSTTTCFINLLPEIKERIAYAVSSSNQSTAALEKLGIKVQQLTEAPHIYVDGADEATSHGHLIKGGGGSLVREKIIAAASHQFLCIIDKTKLKEQLGAFPLAIEVLPLAQHSIIQRLKDKGAQVSVRPNPSDNGNTLLDATGLDFSNPQTLETELNCWAGVIDNGIFAHHKATHILCATTQQVAHYDCTD